MANETSSRDNLSRQQTSDRDNSSRQQSSERAQSGVSTTQQGGGSSRSTSGSLAGQGSQNPGTSSGQNASTWQSGRTPQSGALQHRGGSSLSPWSSGFESGYGPFAMMRRISDEMDRLFENFGMGRGLTGYDPQGFGNPQRTQGASSMWSPHVEVMEREGKLVIQADLPGIKREDVNVEIEQDAVVIQGHRHQEQTSDQSGYYRSERSYGSFYRTIPLPEGTNADSASATFRDGVLKIELDAPRGQRRGRALEIKDGNSQS